MLVVLAAQSAFIAAFSQKLLPDSAGALNPKLLADRRFMEKFLSLELISANLLLLWLAITRVLQLNFLKEVI
tara:strand:- start:500 stop:715 length:216 start_codon:yes stop_codon:yes gene_type:complete